ncbi:MAG: hypothetical protein RIS22_1075, partial [Actinomycetota bacterium]
MSRNFDEIEDSDDVSRKDLFAFKCIYFSDSNGFEQLDHFSVTVFICDSPSSVVGNSIVESISARKVIDMIEERSMKCYSSIYYSKESNAAVYFINVDL